MIEDIDGARARLRARLAGCLREGPVARFDEALTHPSYSNEAGIPHNQRLEFLGDAVLGLCVSELLVGSHPNADEGLLSRMRSALVNADALARWARSVGIGEALALGRGARAGGEADQTNVLADAVEALVAAVYLERGLDDARRLVGEVVAEPLASGAGLGLRDPKSTFQERVQGQGQPTPSYRVAAVRGPAQEPIFEVEVLIGDDVVGRGEGRSKRLAERAAATDALSRLPEEPAGSGEG